MYKLQVTLRRFQQIRGWQLLMRRGHKTLAHHSLVALLHSHSCCTAGALDSL